MVPLLLVLSIAFLTQTVPKPAAPTAAAISAADTLATERIDPTPEPSGEDSTASWIIL